MCADPKSAKKTDCLTLFFGLLRSARVKAAYEMLMKLSRDSNPRPRPSSSLDQGASLIWKLLTYLYLFFSGNYIGKFYTSLRRQRRELGESRQQQQQLGTAQSQRGSLQTQTVDESIFKTLIYDNLKDN